MKILVSSLSMALFLSSIGAKSYGQCSNVPASTAPVTVDDEVTTIPNSRQLVNGTGTSVNATVPGQISLSAVLSDHSLVTSNTTGAVGNLYPVSTASGAVAFTLPDATAAANQGGTIAVFLKTAGNTLTFDTTASQTMGGIASGSLSTSTANTLFYFVSDGSNWQYWQNPPTTSASGTVNTGTAGQVAYYPSSTNAVSGDANLTVSSGAVTVGTSSNPGSVALANGSSTNKITSASLSGNETCTLPAANSNPIQPLSSATSNQWVQYINSSGVQELAQPGFSNLSGTATTAQLPSNVVTSSGNCSPLFTSSISSQTQSFALSNATGPCWFGLSTSGSGAPAYQTGIIPSSLLPSSSSAVFGGNGHDGAHSVTSSSGAATSKSLRYWTTYAISGSGTQDTYLDGSIINCNSTFTTTATGNAGATSGDINGYSQGWQQGGPGIGNTTTTNYGGGGGGSVYAAGGQDYPAVNNNASFAYGFGATSGAIRPQAGSAGGNAAVNNASNNEPGGNGGGSIIVEAAGAVNFNPSSADNVVNVSGAAGPGSTYGGGGGGAGAFFCYSQASISVGSHATIMAAGGAGGTGSAADRGGSGGAGGVIYLMSPSNTVSGTLTVSGGAAGTDGYAAGSNGVSVQVTDTPTLPVISLDLDFRALRSALKIAQWKQHSDRIKLTEKEHDSFTAAYNAAPGKYHDLLTALKQDNVDPRPLCADRFFGFDHKGGNEYTVSHCQGLPSIVPAEPVCIVDYQVGDRI